jgi:hypothetical protein
MADSLPSKENWAPWLGLTVRRYVGGRLVEVRVIG